MLLLRLPVAPLLSLMLSCALLWGCHPQKQQDTDAMKQAHALFAEAEQLVASAQLQEAGSRYQRATSLLSDVRRRHTRASADQLADGPLYLGQSARAWEDQWKVTIAQDIDVNFEGIRASATAGGQRWHEARDFIAQYGGRELEQRWLAASDAIAAAAATRATQQIVFDCDSPNDPDYCTELRRMIAPKLMHPITDETASTAVRQAAFAVVSVQAKVMLETYRQTGGANTVGTTAVTEIPRQLTVSIQMESHHGATTWDGERHVSVEAPLPTSFAWVEETSAKQTRVLREKMAESLAALEPQRTKR